MHGTSRQGLERQVTGGARLKRGFWDIWDMALFSLCADIGSAGIGGRDLYENYDIMIMEERQTHVRIRCLKLDPYCLMRERSAEGRVRDAAEV